MMRFEAPQRSNREWTARRDGGAYVVEVVPRTEFSFGFAASTPASYVPLVSGIPAFDWVSGILVVRVHAASGFSSNSLIVEVRNVSITPEDPTIIFGASATALTTTALTSAAVAGELRSVALVAPIGPMLEVGLKTSGTAATAMKATLSIDVVGRTS